MQCVVLILQLQKIVTQGHIQVVTFKETSSHFGAIDKTVMSLSILSTLCSISDISFLRKKGEIGHEVNTY